jgi:hypothetical protein
LLNAAIRIDKTITYHMCDAYSNVSDFIFSAGAIVRIVERYLNDRFSSGFGSLPPDIIGRDCQILVNNVGSLLKAL